MAGSYIYKPEAVVEMARFPLATRRDLAGTPTFKYLDYKAAHEMSAPYIRTILDSVRLSGQYKYVVVDVKIKEMKAGEYPCLPGWHTDCTLDPNHETKSEIHHIFVSGADCRTRFITSPVEVSLVGNMKSEINRAIKEQDPETLTISEGVLMRYGRDNIHAPSRAGKDGLRLLVRVTETDLIVPKKRI